MKKISLILGTRPEAIKLCPLILALRNNADFECRVCVTAQHREMLDQVLEIFNVKPDADLGLMRQNQSLGDFTARAIQAIDEYLVVDKPDLVLVQGDTTTVFCAALAAFYHRIPVGHVEAGLRTGNMNSPWPEEANRVLASRLSTLHFAPTQWAAQNLINEGVPKEKIHVTGNTVIDALFIALEKIKKNPPYIQGLPDFLQPATAKEFNSQNNSNQQSVGIPGLPDFHQSTDSPIHGFTGSLVLITGHRRESFGDGFENICRAIAELARRFPQTHFVYPVHLNPNVREPVFRILSSTVDNTEFADSSLRELRGLYKNIHLIEPLIYLSFIALMNRATLMLTDSGGVQEEAPSLGKPVLVIRDTTERPEAVKAGTVKLVGANYDKIVEGVTELLTNQSAYDAMSRAHNPYGDGHATERIISACSFFLNS